MVAILCHSPAIATIVANIRIMAITVVESNTSSPTIYEFLQVADLLLTPSFEGYLESRILVGY